ncbi:MAG: pyruvate kinase, partial [Gallionella sp.]|nr:pyruvate kinase [Gallionella sp.]
AEGEAEVHALDRRSTQQKYARIDQSIAMAALFAASHFNVRAIVAMTQSGSTALWMSRVNASVPIFALTPNPQTLTKVTLFSGVHPVLFPSSDSQQTHQELIDAEMHLVAKGYVKDGDLVVVTVGESIGKSGHTNTMKIVRIGDHHKNSI